MTDGNNEAVKRDCGKPRFDLLPMEALAQVQAVLESGAAKYSRGNWQKGMHWLRLWNAAMRHLWAWLRGENNDPESGLPHLAHAICCLMFLLWYAQYNVGVDDRD